MFIYLDEIMSLNSTNELVKYIGSIYSNSQEAYIPVLINEGNYIKDLEADFYLKLVIKHKEIDINKTWLMNNLHYGLPIEKDIYNLNKSRLDDLYIHNLIVYRNYKNSNIYQINPLLTSSDYYQEEGVKNLKYVEGSYSEEYHQNNRESVLTYKKKGKDEYLNILKKMLSGFVIHEQQEWENVYELVVEFEYRNKNHAFMENDFVENSNGVLEFSNSEGYGLYVKGSIKVPLILESSKPRNIKVIDLGTHEIRNHNPNNYNGDTDEGFVIFSSDVISILEDYYFFYGIEMIEKENVENTLLVDYLGDKVVFWEAEYNKLSQKIKDKIDKYNITIDVSKDRFISKAMFTMQLEASWNWDKELEPDKKLGYDIKNLMFDKAININLNFIYPKNTNKLKEFINSIENLTNIKLEVFNTNASDVDTLLKIRDGRLEGSLESEKIVELYLKYCYAISKKLEGGI